MQSEQRIIRFDLFDDEVDGHDNHKTDQRLIQANCGSGREVEVCGNTTINVGLDDVGRREQQRVGTNDVVEQAEVTFNDAAQSKQEKNNNGRFQSRQDNVPNLAETVGAVYLRRLDDACINAHDRGKVYNRVITCVLPQIDQNQNRRPNIRVRIGLPQLQSEAAQDVVDKTGIVVEHVEYQNTDQDLRYKIRQEHQTLGYLFEHLTANFVEQDRHQYRKQIAQNDKAKVVQDGGDGKLYQLAGRNQELKVVQTDKFTAKDAVTVIVLDKCNPNTRKRHVAEQKEKQDRRGTH